MATGNQKETGHAKGDRKSKIKKRGCYVLCLWAIFLSMPSLTVYVTDCKQPSLRYKHFTNNLRNTSDFREVGLKMPL